jgi:hypothetical protein
VKHTKEMRGGVARRVSALGLAATALVPACGNPGDAPVPSVETVEAYFTIPARSSVSIRGNVAEIQVYQPADDLRRGGSLWAKVGPYIYLFSDGTRRLFEEQPGIGGLRVVTLTTGGDEIARATLPSAALNDVTWRRALNISGRARRDGTDQPVVLEELVRWGEDHTDFEYSPEYTRSR